MKRRWPYHRGLNLMLSAVSNPKASGIKAGEKLMRKQAGRDATTAKIFCKRTMKESVDYFMDYVAYAPPPRERVGPSAKFWAGVREGIRRWGTKAKRSCPR